MITVELITQVLISMGSIFILGGGLMAIVTFPPNQRKAMDLAKLLVAIGILMFLIAIAIHFGLPDMMSKYLATFGFN